jgi:hypothetical protein
VAFAMFAVPNIDRLRAFRRFMIRRPVRRGRDQRLVASGLTSS